MSEIEEKKENHKTLVVRITEILPIKDADKVEIVKFGLPYQCVSQKETFKVGDLAVYVQPDSVVPVTEPFRFIWEPYQVSDPGDITTFGTVPEKRRRITVKKIRGEWSEGLLLPVGDFKELMEDAYGTLTTDGVPFCFYEEGNDVSEVLGVTHYQPVEDEGKAGLKPIRRLKKPKTLKAWFYFILHKLHVRRQERFLENAYSLDYPKYDVDALKSQTYNPFIDQEVVITEKIHGSSARYVFLDGKMYAGSRNLWLAPESTGYATAALKANPQIETWCRTHEGFALYGEVTPTQKGFDYGTKKHQFFLFDIRSPKGDWLDSEDPLYFSAFDSHIENVPLLYKGEYGEVIVKYLAEGTESFVHYLDPIHQAKNIREGIVIKTLKEKKGHGRRNQFKIVNNTFLKKDSE